VPPFVIFLLGGQDTGALVVFAAAAISDFIDGFLARRLGQQTALGRFLDPLADKLLAGTAFILLAVRQVLPDWLAVVVISRECVIVAGMVLLNMLDVRVEVAPSRIGKWNTAFQLTTVCAALLVSLIAPSPWPPLLAPFLAACICHRDDHDRLGVPVPVPGLAAGELRGRKPPIKREITA
jgi:cardiolipin synthase